MAIDDNTSYELTGAQVKDLANKIKAKAADNIFVGATSAAPGSKGLVPQPQAGDDTKFLSGDGTWKTVSSGGGSYTAGNGISIDANNEISIDDTVVAEVSDLPTDFTGATSSAAGSNGLVPAPSAGDEGKVLSGAGTWVSQPTVPTVNDATLTITQNGTSAGTFTANASSNATIALTDTTYSDFTGATSSTAGAHGLVPAPAAGDEGKALHGDGTWKDTTAKLVEMSYGESNAWAKFIAAYNAGSIVYCRASSNANPGTGSQTRKAFMAYVNNATSPTNVEFQYVRSQSSKTDSQQTDQVFVYTLTNASGGTWSVASRNMGPKIVAGTGMTSTFTTGANATITLNAEQNYSTSEVDTKVKWVDGKTIYRKTINFGALPNATAKYVAHGISNLNYVVKIEGAAEASNSTWITLPVVYRSADAAYNVEVSASTTDVICNTSQDRSMFTAYITLYYTKSS